MDVQFLVLVYFVGMFVDWVFQTNWQAANKSRWASGDNKTQSLRALLTHAVIYGAGTTLPVALLLGRAQDLGFYGLVLTALTVTHAFIDSRIPVRWVMKYVKRMRDDQIDNYAEYGFLHLGIDHRLHELVIVFLSFFV